MAALGGLRMYTGGSPNFNEQTGMYGGTPAAPAVGGNNPLAGLSDPEKYAVFGGAGGGQALTQDGSWARQLHDSFGTPYSNETGQSNAFKNWLNDMSYGAGAKSYFDPTTGNLSTRGAGTKQLDLSAFGIQPSGSVTPAPVAPATPRVSAGIDMPGVSTVSAQPLSALSGSYGQGPSAELDINKFLDPSMNFRIKQGTDALENSAAARGGLLSGATLKGVSDYAQNTASQEYANAYNRAYQDRGYNTDVFRDARNFGYGVDRDDRDFAYRSQVDDRNFNFDRDRYNNDFAYRQAVDNRNFEYGSQVADRSYQTDLDKWNQEFGYKAATGDRAFNYNTLSDLARLGLAGTQGSSGMQQQLANLLNNNILAGGNAGAAGSIGGANSINQMISQLLSQLNQQQILGLLGGG